MLDVALKLLKKFTSCSFQAYIVGGFVRDYLLGIKSSDIDIATNATPKEIKEMFPDSCLPNEDYGSVTVFMNGIRFEITTFRKEIGYINNRRPEKIKYIDSLEEDLKRRDFIINTICMDEDGVIVDYLNGQEDLNKRVIRTVGNSFDKFTEDCLRILRAVRFATILDFSLDSEIVDAICACKGLLRKLSYDRKKEELEKIFTSPNAKNGIQLLLDMELDQELEIPNLYKVLNSKNVSLIGIWTVLDVTDKYPFNKNEMQLIKKVKKALNGNVLDPMMLYKYGLYVCSVAGEIKNQDIKKITEAYNKLIIKNKKDININSKTIMNLLSKNSGEYIGDIYNDIEKEILYKRLNNNEEEITIYIKNKYFE